MALIPNYLCHGQNVVTDPEFHCCFLLFSFLQKVQALQKIVSFKARIENNFYLLDFHTFTTSMLLPIQIMLFAIAWGKLVSFINL